MKLLVDLRLGVAQTLAIEATTDIMVYLQLFNGSVPIREEEVIHVFR